MKILLSSVNTWFPLGLFVFSIFSSIYVYFRFRRLYLLYSRDLYPGGPSPRDFCRRIASREDLGSLRIDRADTPYSDRYDFSEKVLFLAKPEEKSVAALSVAAHEMGHVVQSREFGFLYSIRSRLTPWADFSAIAAVPLILAGLLFCPPLALSGAILYLAGAVVVISSFPLELKASRKGRTFLENSPFLSADQLKEADKILLSAALTYVASVTSSFFKLAFRILHPRGVFDERS